MTLLVVDDLQVAVRGGRAVDGVSLSLNQGEVLALMGESGAGKSLTGAAIIGLLPKGTRKVGGRILLDGLQIDRLDAAAWRRVRGRRISAVFQDPMTALDPLRSIGDQLAETLKVHRPQLAGKMLHDRVVDWLEAVSLPASRAGAFPHELSGGMRQRVALALAMCPGPDILIADEPTTALDMPLRAQLAALMRRLARGQGTTVLLISHDLRTIEAAADRVAVMYAGRIVETGPTAEVLQSPLHPYVAGLLASMPSMSVRKRKLATIPGAMPPPGAVPTGCGFRPRCTHAAELCREQRPALPSDGAACFHPLGETAND